MADTGALMWLSCMEKPKTIRKVGLEWGYSNPFVTFQKEKIDELVEKGLLTVAFEDEREIKGKKSIVTHYQTSFETYFTEFPQYGKKSGLDYNPLKIIKFFEEKETREKLFNTQAILDGYMNVKENTEKNPYYLPFVILFIFRGVDKGSKIMKFGKKLNLNIREMLLTSIMEIMLNGVLSQYNINFNSINYLKHFTDDEIVYWAEKVNNLF